MSSVVVWRAIHESTREREGTERLGWAWKYEESENPGLKSNALLILSEFYRNGWHPRVTLDEVRGYQLLHQAALLGHARACWDMTIHTWYKNKNLEWCRKYLNAGLEHVDDASYDCEREQYVQASWKQALVEQLAMRKIRERYPGFAG
jgi:hypothetical protein